ncbi:unnamed protein product [Bradyrhizobium oligotrophicum S58]|uniref:Unnamed protein product n=1 Tax=Bradyrhizobium oligotrophicum S58 TaxID=1245469 RepID=M4ZT74_9BRAD|nr:MULTISPECIES: metallophosphoesterase [Bradyrhizobium]BAM89495.1 unnamed protein product [Bradyrhizobium oligotrophicum S58]
MRSVFIISDLHLGGAYPDPPTAGARGFRLCTRADAIAQFVAERTAAIADSGPSEIVLNGDTVDFLAECDRPPPAAATWSSFTADPQAAAEKFKSIVRRDRQVFEALSAYLDAGGRLTVLLGNHDIELSLPAIRDALRTALGVKAHHDFEFLFDGEAYIVGDALIEHGNRYDAWNQVDYDALRHVRSFQSRRLPIPEDYAFGPPPGSDMVTTVINPIKVDYPFIDLLKPETEAVVPMLLALEPGFRAQIGKVAMLLARSRRHGLRDAVTPRLGSDISANSPLRALEGDNLAAGAYRGGLGGDIATGGPAEQPPRADAEQALKLTLSAALGSENAAAFLRDIDSQVAAIDPLAAISTDISAGETVRRVFGFAALLFGRSSKPYTTRLPALLEAIRALQNTQAFDQDKETATEYLNAATDLAAKGGFRYVVFGHTHLAKRVPLANGGLYLNSGTWADVLRFPAETFRSESEALTALETFVDHMKSGDFSPYTVFTPTYVHLQVGTDGKVASAELLPFTARSAQ